MSQFQFSLFYVKKEKGPILKKQQQKTKTSGADTTDCDRFITTYHGKYVWKKT